MQGWPLLCCGLFKRVDMSFKYSYFNFYTPQSEGGDKKEAQEGSSSQPSESGEV